MDQHDRNHYTLSAAALVMSALAMIFAFMELRSSDRQLDASVWPYVDLTISLNGDEFSLDLSNKGMGPALIHEFRLVHQDEGELDAVDLMHLAEVRDRVRTTSTSSVIDSVLSVGETLNAFRFEGEQVGREMAALVAKLDIQICYCSINGACWHNRADNAFRTPIQACATTTTDAEQMLEALERLDSATESDPGDQ